MQNAITEPYKYHSSGRPLNVDIALPSNHSSSKNYQMLICYHGGGLVCGSRHTFIPFHLVSKLRGLGWIIIFPDYQFLPEATGWDIRQNVLDLEQWILKDQDTWGIDVDKIVLSGTSAGGYLGALAGVTWKTIKPQAFASIYGMVDLTGDWYSAKKDPGLVILGVLVDSIQEAEYRKYYENDCEVVWDGRETGDDRWPIFMLVYLKMIYGRLLGKNNGGGLDESYLHPLSRIDSSFPKTIAIHGDQDSAVKISDSYNLVDRVRKAGIKSEILVIEGAEHGLMPEAAHGQECNYVVDFLQRATETQD
ncbi:alpha/beta-hydrolase [Tuber magnatum]|uniref:Alpha/beta-hydrolase n=1 Tax=Tuber magnatum TaxID=42249 RepID=A0A317SAX7_9PEZI|nr:alpha/beta-hydrolase [Tuber magnatum]